MTETDLLRFLMTEHTDTQVRALVGAAPNGAPRRGLLAQLREYARCKRHAIRARLEGKIDRALTLESRLDRMYDEFPDVLRW